MTSASARTTVGGLQIDTVVQSAQNLLALHQDGRSSKPIPLAVLQAMSILARPFQPAFARKLPP